MSKEDSQSPDKLTTKDQIVGSSIDQKLMELESKLKDQAKVQDAAEAATFDQSDPLIGWRQEYKNKIKVNASDDALGGAMSHRQPVRESVFNVYQTKIENLESIIE